MQEHETQRVFSAAFSKNNRIKSSAFWKIQKSMEDKKIFGKSKSQANFNPILDQVCIVNFLSNPRWAEN